MLIEIAIGDAYGAGFEYADPALIRRANTVEGYVRHPTHRLRPGNYTDDTQMSIAVAEAIVSGEPWTPEMIAGRFVEAFHRDPREGYAQGFYHFLRGVRDGREFIERIRPVSDKSGAAMRAAPLGVFATVEEVIEKCSVQAALTHDTPDGINAAVAAALAAHYFLYDIGPKNLLGDFLESRVPGEWGKPWRGKVGSKGWMSVRAAVTAIMASDSFSGILRAAVEFTGDVDTVAAIALGAASCSPLFINDLPQRLYDDLENDRYGFDYIEGLDAALMAIAGARAA